MATSYIIIGFTAIISFLAFSNVDIISKSIFYPYDIKRKNEWFRFISHGFIHADMQHLFFNMFTFFFFGPYLEQIFSQVFGTKLFFIFYYILALILSSVYSYFKHKDDAYYRALGASGAISAILFSFILFDPWHIIYIYVLPVPGIIYALFFVGYSIYMGKKNIDNVGHDAHLWGAVFGFIFPIVAKPSILPYFIEKLLHPNF